MWTMDGILSDKNKVDCTPHDRMMASDDTSDRTQIQKPDLIEVLSALLRGEAQIVGGVLELAYYRAAGYGQAFPTRERRRVLD